MSCPSLPSAKLKTLAVVFHHSFAFVFLPSCGRGCYSFPHLEVHFSEKKKYCCSHSRCNCRKQRISWQYLFFWSIWKMRFHENQRSFYTMIEFISPLFSHNWLCYFFIISLSLISLIQLNFLFDIQAESSKSWGIFLNLSEILEILVCSCLKISLISLWRKWHLPVNTKPKDNYFVLLLSLSLSWWSILTLSWIAAIFIPLVSTIWAPASSKAMTVGGLSKLLLIICSCFVRSTCANCVSWT